MKLKQLKSNKKSKKKGKMLEKRDKEKTNKEGLMKLEWSKFVKWNLIR
jgi:hypothetical protein